MKCNKCNQEIPDNSMFCLHCGAKVEVTDVIVCPKCGYKNPLEAVFCTECGNCIKTLGKENILNGEKSVDRKFNSELTVKNKNGLWGIVNKYNINILPYEYLLIGTINCDLAVVKHKNGLYGFVNNRGEIAIPCKYTSSAGFIRNRAMVKEGNKFGIIDKSGKTIIPTIYDQIKESIPEYFVVQLCGLFGIIKGDGRKIVPLTYDKIEFRIDAFILYKNDKIELFKID